MTNPAPDRDLRPTLEGTLADFPIAQLLALLASTRQTGTLQVAAKPSVLLTIVNGRVAFASTDASFTVRDLLVGGGHVSAALWQLTVTSGLDPSQLGTALVEGGASETAIADALRDHVVTICETLVDQPAVRFRFVRQPRSSMGENFTCPSELLQARLEARRETWNRLRSLVADDDITIAVRQELDPSTDPIHIARADWPVLLRLAEPSTVNELSVALDRPRFDITHAIERLFACGAISVDGNVHVPEPAAEPSLEPATAADDTAGSDKDDAAFSRDETQDAPFEDAHGVAEFSEAVQSLV